MALQLVDDIYCKRQQKLQQEQLEWEAIKRNGCPCKKSGFPNCYGCLCICERSKWHCKDHCTNC